MVLCADMSESVANELLECYVLKLFTRALGLSCWLFQMKETVYKALGKLSYFPKFLSKLEEANGISVAVFEVNLRKKAGRKSRRARANAGGEEEDDDTEQLLIVLRPHVACTKIQAVVRKRIARTRVKEIRERKAQESKDRAKKTEDKLSSSKSRAKF